MERKIDLEQIYRIEKTYHDSIASEQKGLADIGRYELESWSYIIEVIGDLNGKKILDVGCGFGRESILMAEKGAVVTGIDISPKSIEVAKMHAKKRRVDINFQIGNAENMGFLNAFDIVLCRASLHHLPQVRNAIMESFKALKLMEYLFVRNLKQRIPLQY